MSTMEMECEHLYYMHVEMFDSVNEKNKRTKSDFQSTFEALFSAAALYIKPHMDRYDIQAVERWRAKLRVAAGEYYDNNIQREREQAKRDEEEQQRREADARNRERERREHERELIYREEVQDLYEKWESSVEDLGERVNEVIARADIEELKSFLDILSEEIVELKFDIEDLLHSDKKRFDKWYSRIYQYQEDVKGKIDEELARIEAERQAQIVARRKANDEKNKIKLAEMQAAQRSKYPQFSSSGGTFFKETTKLVCPQCGNQVSNTSKFCTSCGTKLLVTCPECGITLKATTKFCTMCGKQVNGL